MTNYQAGVIAWVAMLIALISLLLFVGCSGFALLHGIDSTQGLSAEQIKALRDTGHSVYGCFQIGGPPPAGNMVWIIVPQGTPVNFKFGDNCHVIQ